MNIDLNVVLIIVLIIFHIVKIVMLIYVRSVKKNIITIKQGVLNRKNQEKKE